MPCLNNNNNLPPFMTVNNVNNAREVKEDIEWEMLQLVDDPDNLTANDRVMIINTLRLIRDEGSECEFWSDENECPIDRDSFLFKSICNYLIIKFETE